MVESHQNGSIEIVVIEDELDILELIEYHLQKEGFNVTGFLSTEHVEQFLEEESVDLMIVDRNLPNIEGSKFVAHLRDKGENTPVIFLSAKDKSDEIEEGFLRGGDDYLTKPFSHKEMILRVKAILRRTGVSKRSRIKYRDILLDLDKNEAYINDTVVNLTLLELNLLHTFILNSNKVLDRAYLIEQVWKDQDEEMSEKTVNVAIRRLKKKIDPEEAKNYIVSVWGVGYKMA